MTKYNGSEKEVIVMSKSVKVRKHRVLIGSDYS